MNPFLNDYETPFKIPPFEEIEFAHYEPAFDIGMKEHLKEIEEIANNQQEPTFENTIEAMERSGETLDKVANVFFNLLGSNTNDDMDALAMKISPKLSAHNDSILLNKELFKRIKELFDNKGSFNLTTEQNRLLEETYKRFIRSGANLDNQSMERLTQINSSLSSLSVQFDQNVLKETNSYSMVIENEEDLDGLPAEEIRQASLLADSEGQSGKWVFKPTRVSMYPFLTYSTQRDLREELYNSYIQRGDNDNAYDNKEIIAEMISLRKEKASMMGFDSHSDYVLDNTMAKTPENVNKLLQTIWKPGVEKAKGEVEEMQKLISDEGGNFELAAWDWWHYSEKLRQEKFDFKEEEVKPYFSEDKVLAGAFDVAQKLFDITFTERNDLPKYRENIRSFIVEDLNKKVIGIFYTDFTLRPNKGGGAWMNTFRSQSKFDGEIIPIVINVCNFPPENADGVSLLSFEQVETLFHEFGHGLHGLLSDAQYPSLSGTSVTRDYVEFPSQMMENWAREPSVIKTFAKHYETGETIPEDLLNKISAAGTFNEGFATTEYVAAAHLDMAYHTDQGLIEDIDKFEDETLNDLGLIPEIESRYRSTYFGHIFAGGYSSGYYSYLWTEVLEADAFEAFKDKGLFDKETADKLKKYVYAAGNTDDLMTQYVRFRGKEPEIEPLLKKRGLN
ncbi:MAG: M3 family metallopeptidase [Gammaproteobacteria bacterium]|tara:strand:- start:50 stop:2074 length:2025 start_codon:yes stop_codon:yes gene_type:complete